MTTAILHLRDPNNSYRLALSENNGEDTVVYLPLLLLQRDYGKAKKRRITKNHSPTPTDPQIAVLLPQIIQNPYNFHLTISKHQQHKAFNV
jgi:hypothetical protein